MIYSYTDYIADCALSRFAGTSEEAGASTLTQPYVKRDNLIEACGDAARTLKSYQLVGINFLMMLHKSESVGEVWGPKRTWSVSRVMLNSFELTVGSTLIGGAILADEMGLGKTAQVRS